MPATLALFALLSFVAIGSTRAQSLNDPAPTVVSTNPPDNAVSVSPSVTPTITFSEPVAVAEHAISLVCAITQDVSLTVADGPITFTLTPSKALAPNDSCIGTVLAHLISDLDLDDPPDILSGDFYWSFTTAAALAPDVIINEVDAITDANGNEFIELYDGGGGNTGLDGLQLAFYNGATDSIYTNVVLNGHRTDANGYFLLSSDPATADMLLTKGALLDGPAAVALYAAPAGALPIGSPPTLGGLLDAIVYDNGQPDDDGLLPLLEPGEPQIDESGRGLANADSNQRCPNATGGQRRTSTYRQSTPTPGAANVCPADAPPHIVQSTPPDGEVVDPAALTLQLTFSEPVTLATGAIELVCTRSGSHTLTVTGGPVTFSAVPQVAPDFDENCSATVFGQHVSDLDTEDPPDRMVVDYKWRITTAKRVATHMLINEVDSDTPGQDTAEFIELFDGGDGSTDLSGLVVVLYNGSIDKSYRTIDLTGQQTDASGYFVIGNDGVIGRDLVLPNAALQNGPDAVALFAGQAADFPIGTAVTTSGLLDALVYGPSGTPDRGLLPLLLPAEVQVDENGRAEADLHSNQRCPNGSGGQRRTAAFRPNLSTPGAANVCAVDDAPRVVATSPADGALNVALDATLTVTFSEPVALKSNWFKMECDNSGAHGVMATGGPETWSVTVNPSPSPDERCTATIVAGRVSDADVDDPPDKLVENVTWSFTMAGPAVDFVLINEIDTDTPGIDQAEFIELYDGGQGRTALDGLTVVLFNGNGDLSYQALSLNGRQTDAEGYFVIGNSAVPGVDLVTGNGVIQNGPDAVALYAAGSGMFPNNSPLTKLGLLDAVVYGGQADEGLVVLLASGQPMVNEDSGGSGDTHSLQRCPNGSGGPRHTATIGVGNPTPGQTNSCISDDPPRLVSMSPVAGAGGVALDCPISLTFSEPVILADAVSLVCDQSKVHVLIESGGPEDYEFASKSPFMAGEACQVKVRAAGVTDLDAIDPPDTMDSDVSWQFQTAAKPVASVLINEFDVDTAGIDTAEFIELYDGGQGNQSLDGLVIVLFNGGSDTSYRTIDLAGISTDKQGYAVLGGPDVPDAAIQLASGAIQNGSDAIAVYAGTPQQYPNGSVVSVNGLVDAVVYGTNDPDDTGLLPLLLSGQPQVNESSRSATASDANARCPNGDGLARATSGFIQTAPTPGAANYCVSDVAPSVVATIPAAGATGVVTLPKLEIEFSEPVTADSGWLRLDCAASGLQVLAPQGGPTRFTAVPSKLLTAGERCQASIDAGHIHDQDSVDPPDTLDSDMFWSFEVAGTQCGLSTTPIAAIQGTGAKSPLVGKTVTTVGVLTADFRAGLGGAFVQSPDDLADSKPASSEGLFVVFAGDPGALLIGDRLLMTGKVSEVSQRTAIIDATLMAICNHDDTIEPLTLTQLPDNNAGWEKLESMLVTFGPVTILDNHALVTAGEMIVGAGDRPIYPTEYLPPGSAAQAQLETAASRTVILDDARIDLPPTPLPLAADRPLRSGDQMPGITGIVDGFQGGARLQPTVAPSVVIANPRPVLPAGPGEALRVVSIDLGTYANGDGDGHGFTNPAGAQSTAEYLRQRHKIIALLAGIEADVIALNGLENDGTGVTSATADLLATLNTSIGDTEYQLAAAPGGPTFLDYQSAVFYRPARVTRIAVSAIPLAEAKAGHAALPLVVTLLDKATGDELTVALIDLVPRADCPTDGPDADQGDGQACHNNARTQAATAVGEWLTRLGTPGETLIVGRWNAYSREDPLQAIKAAGFEDLTPMLDGTLSNDYTTIETGHTGATQRLAAGSGVATQITQSAVWHGNADEPPAFDYHMQNPSDLYAPDAYRSAPVDPIIVDLMLGQLRAAFNTQPAVFIGETSRFQNESTGAGPLQFSWDFGDGSPVVDARDPDHAYAHIGTYQVTLTVANSQSSHVVSQTVDVLPRRSYAPVITGATAGHMGAR